MRPKLLIVGAGGLGQAVAEAASESGMFEVVGFVDDRRVFLYLVALKI
jgi:FlaA1/EpsC-like NDP-sugar epimerase